MTRFQRERDSGEEQRATTLELFYDLVFVFAITQVSHLLLDNLTWQGAGHASLVLLVVWWAWNYTTWVTNELDPDSIAVRLLLMGIMLGSLLMAVAIPQAFGAHGLLFAGAYVAIQVGRHTLHDLRVGGSRNDRAGAGGTHPHVVRGRRDPLDRGRFRRRVGADRRSGSLRWPSTTPHLSRSSGCRDGHGSPNPRGTWRLRTSPSASSSS